jgi:hypothetical protein
VKRAGVGYVAHLGLITRIITPRTAQAAPTSFGTVLQTLISNHNNYFPKKTKLI